MDRFRSGAEHVQLQNTFSSRVNEIEALAHRVIDANQPNADGEFIVGNAMVP
jgi:hypothetical protein